MRPKALVLAGFVTGVVAGTVLYRRGSQGRRERVDLYFDDGSMVSLGDGSAGADRLLPIARSVLTASRRS